jgi:WD40 repeat protein
VLIVGGGDQDTEAIASVELWDPIQGAVTELSPTHVARVAHAATLLDDGRVLVVGGLERGPAGEVLGPTMTAEVWDPTTRSFSDAGSAAGPFAMPTATRLEDGRVLVLGGGPDRTTALVWDPATGAFTPTGSLHEGRAGGQTATLLPDGSVLVIGGLQVSTAGAGQPMVTALASVEVWDPVDGVFHEAPPLPEGRYDHTSTLLPDGRIVVAGGMASLPDAPTEQVVSDAVLTRDPVSGVFHPAGRLTAQRTGHTAQVLPDCEVLLVGGDRPAAVGTVETWEPSDGSSTLRSDVSPRHGGDVTALPDGTLLLSGGTLPADADVPGAMALGLEVYDPTP